MFSLSTPRLTLRDLINEDWKLFVDMMSEPVTISYMKGHLPEPTESEAKQWVAQRIGYNSKNPRQSYNLAIEFENTPIGWIGIGEAETEELKDWDFGYALKKDYWGKGFATEALRSLISFCYKYHPLTRITGECYTRNIASRRVMEKAGLTLIKEFTTTDKTTGHVKEQFRYHILRPS